MEGRKQLDATKSKLSGRNIKWRVEGTRVAVRAVGTLLIRDDAAIYGFLATQALKEASNNLAHFGEVVLEVLGGCVL